MPLLTAATDGAAHQLSFIAPAKRACMRLLPSDDLLCVTCKLSTCRPRPPPAVHHAHRSQGRGAAQPHVHPERGQDDGGEWFDLALKSASVSPPCQCQLLMPHWGRWPAWPAAQPQRRQLPSSTAPARLALPPSAPIPEHRLCRNLHVLHLHVTKLLRQQPPTIQAPDPPCTGQPRARSMPAVAAASATCLHGSSP